ncbi:VHS domain-containing protein At3g16270 [Morus notabilis]|uniref:VHS domain-containing protein At3g16270 n=1 Tax=Morus notabilis TaxID=981085 RepID=UPI000CECEDD5|nr:VHS domain-containing protein At3g16270 [Morus notabilis]
MNLWILWSHLNPWLKNETIKKRRKSSHELELICSQTFSESLSVSFQTKQRHYLQPKSRMIDAATSDEDKVTPVYKLEEICELLRSSHVSIVKEVSEFVLKRLDHKSPIVKQKALRLIKYCLGKSGVEFRREMQRHSVAVRQLFHYKGQLDPLVGDALNKAVRDTAHEAISAIFSEENKPAPVEDRNKRIQGFGSTNYEMPSEDKKSFLSEVVGIGSASIKQGISSFTQSHSLRKNDNGSYKSPNLHRSLTKETEYTERYEPVEYRNETQGSSGFSKTVAWGQDSGLTENETTNGNSSSSHSGSKMPEERLVETIVTSGGVRLQPTRDAVLVFLGEASKLNALALSHALETKLQSPMWQVRMKAVCVLESILRKKDDEPFSVVASYFSENNEVVVKCSESPQSSLREKANKVLSLLGGEKTGTPAAISEKLVKAETVAVPMPDLIDTSDPNDFIGTENSEEKQNDPIISNLTTTPPALIDDLFGDGSSNVATTSELRNDDDPFADVSFHESENREPIDDLFSGMTVDGKLDASENHIAGKKSGSELFDIFGSDAGVPKEQENKKDVNDLMAGLSINENGSKMEQKGTSSGTLSQTLFSDLSSDPKHQVSNDVLSGILGSQTVGMNPNFMFPQGAMPYNIPPGLMFNQAFPSQQMNYGAMGNLFAQHLATMSNFQHLGNLTAQNSGGVHVAGTTGGYSSAFPDIFQSNFPISVPSSTTNSSKKEETKAFDFISDHLAAARDPNRLV